MKRILSTTAFVMFIVVIAAVAVYALNGTAASEIAAPAVMPGASGLSSASVLAPDEVTETQNYNVISIPLDAQQQFTDAGYSFDAEGLAGIIGTGVVQVLRWRNDTQLYETYTPGIGGNFNLEVGGVYRVLLDSTAGNIVSFVGDVPPASTEPGHITYNLYGGTPDCLYNVLTVPLDRSDIAMASDLANDIPGTVQVLQWRNDTQLYETYTVGIGGDFVTQIGYPYRICSDDTVPTTWP